MNKYLFRNIFLAILLTLYPYTAINADILTLTATYDYDIPNITKPVSETSWFLGGITVASLDDSNFIINSIFISLAYDQLVNLLNGELALNISHEWYSPGYPKILVQTGTAFLEFKEDDNYYLSRYYFGPARGQYSTYIFGDISYGQTALVYMSDLQKKPENIWELITIPGTISYSIEFSPYYVPLPSTLLLLCSGLMGLAGWKRLSKIKIP